MSRKAKPEAKTADTEIANVDAGASEGAENTEQQQEGRETAADAAAAEGDGDGTGADNEIEATDGGDGADDAAEDVEIDVQDGQGVKFFDRDRPSRDINNPGYRLKGHGPYLSLVTHFDPETKCAHLTVFAPLTPPAIEESVPHKSVAPEGARRWFE